MTERREGHLYGEIGLLTQVPDISLLIPAYPNHIEGTKKILNTFEGKIIHENSDVIVTKALERIFSNGVGIPADLIDDGVLEGTYYVHDKINGLPNYHLYYQRKNDALTITGATVWKYTLPSILSSDEPPFLLSEQTTILNPDENVYPAGTKVVLNGIMPVDRLSLLGEGEIYAEETLPYDESDAKLVELVRKQITLVPGEQHITGYF